MLEIHLLIAKINFETYFSSQFEVKKSKKKYYQNALKHINTLCKPIPGSLYIWQKSDDLLTNNQKWSSSCHMTILCLDIANSRLMDLKILFRPDN